MASAVSQLIVLVAAGVLAARAGSKLRIPEAIPLIITGYVLGVDLLGLWQPAALGIDMGLIALIAIPVILFYDGLRTDAEHLTQIWKTVISVSTVAVLVTVVGIAFFSRVFLGLSWASSLLLGAILSSTDPAGVIPVLRKLNIRKKVSTVLESEAALNDATAITLFTIILGLATGGRLSLQAGVSQLIYVALASSLVGLLVGLAANEVFRRLKLSADLTFASIIVLLTAYGLAEAIGVSSVIAVVIAALIFRYFIQSGHVNPVNRLQTISLWENLNFLAIAIIFLVLGGQIQLATIAPYIPVGLAISLAFIFIVRPLTIIMSMAFDRSFSLKEKLFIAWIGSPRGTVSAALTSIILTKAATGIFSAAEAQAIFSITIIVIITTIAVASLTAGYAAKKLLGASEATMEVEYRTLSTELKSMMIAARRLREEWKEGLVPTKTYDEIAEAHRKQMEKIEEQLNHLAKVAPEIENKSRAARIQELLMNQISALETAYENKELPQESYEMLLSKFHSQIERLGELEDRVPLQPAETKGGKKA